MEPKFVLPSPNFNKNSKESSKSTLHYLTPCGMTLLPRSKQPPPMYGARGSTVPAKYLKPEQPQNSSSATLDAPTRCATPPRPEFCDNCSMSLANAQDMRRHLEQHENCPAENCDFAAMGTVLERHIEAKHITGLYKTVKRVWTPEDIAAWRAERSKRFPTTANVDLAKRAKEQRLKRGERLEASKARFGKLEDRRRTQPERNFKERTKQIKRKKNNVNRTAEKNDTANKKEAVESRNAFDAEEARRFRGTAQMKDYKHVKEKPKLVVNALSNMLAMYGTDSEDEDDEEAATDEQVADTHREPKLREEDAQYQETAQTCDKTSIKRINDAEKSTELSHFSVEPQLCEEISQHELQPAENSVQLPQETLQSTDDESPVEAPIERNKDLEKPIETEATVGNLRIENKPASEGKLQLEHKPTVKRAATKKKILGLNYKRARLMTKQNTMLAKLLETDIRHERNVLLQCVRYVCEQNFFGLGSSSSSTTTTASKI